MHDEERRMLRDSLRRLLAETDPAKLPSALRDFGWFDLLGADPAEAVPALFEVQGEDVVASPMLDAVMAIPLTGTRAVSESFCAVVLPGPGRGDAPASVFRPGGDGPARVEVSGYGLAALPDASRLAVPARHGGEAVICLVEHPDLTISPAGGFDPDFGLLRLEGTATVSAAVTGAEATTAWSEAVAAGRRALAHELVGVTRSALSLAVDHALSRQQFGRVVGSFQAVKHRLAEARVALTCAEATLPEAWEAGDATSALLAKLWAGRAARTVSRHAQQVLGGMGFTWEHPFHRHLRRALVLDSLLGSVTELAAELGRQLVDAGVPRRINL